MSSLFSSKWASVLTVCNSIALVPITMLLIVSFFRIISLQQSLDNEQAALENLKLQVQQEQQGQIADLTTAVQNEHSLTVLQLAGTFGVLTCLVTAFHMSTHLLQFQNPAVQRKIMAILWMSPIYALTSFFGLVWPGADGYLAMIKDFYEAYTIYNFLGFLIAVLGRDQAVEVLNSSHLPRTLVFRDAQHPAMAVLTECQVFTLQFVLIRPLASIGHFIVTSLEEEPVDWSSYWQSPHFWLSMVVNVSVFFAFRGLLTFYHAVHDQIEWLQPLAKFMSIKGIVFLTFWQGLAISILVHWRGVDSSDDEVDSLLDMGNSTTTADIGGADDQQASLSERAAEIQNILICLEMLLFAVAHWCVFPADEWQEDYQPQSFATKPGFGIVEFVSDVSQLANQTRRRRRRVGESESNTEAPQEDFTIDDQTDDNTHEII